MFEIIIVSLNEIRPTTAKYPQVGHLAAPNMHKSCQLLVQICNLHLLVWDLKSGQNLALRLQRGDIGSASLTNLASNVMAHLYRNAIGFKELISYHRFGNLSNR